MKIAVITDIHGNLDAFEAVLADMDEQAPDDVISLGDCVGYGPEPEGVIRTVRERGIPTLLGNHERAVADPIHLDWFNPLAKQSLVRTGKLLSADSLAFIGGLDRSLVRHGCRFVHGFPPDSPTTYLFQVHGKPLQKAFEEMAERICFVGHTHELEVVSFDGESVNHERMERGITPLDRSKKYILNIGSVGQPRDGDNNAKYVLFDPEADTVELRYVPYDIRAVTEKILHEGLPKLHADRLW